MRHRYALVLATAIATAVPSLDLRAGVADSWNDLSGNWSTGAWSRGVPPTAGNDPYFNFADDISRTVTLDVSTPTLGNLLVNSTGSGLIVLSQSANAMSVSNVTLGSTGMGNYAQSGGSFTVSSNLYMGYNNSNGVGVYSLSGSGVLTTSQSYIANGGNSYYNTKATFVQTGGTHNSSNLRVGYSGGQGLYTLSDGQLNTGYSYLGWGGGYGSTGNFYQSGGTHIVTGSLYLTYNSSASTAAYTLTGTGILNVATGYLGDSAPATFTQSGGTASFGNLYLTNNSVGSPSAAYLLSDGLLTTSGNEYIGNTKYGTFNQSGGTNTVGGAMYLGGTVGATGNYALNAGSLTAGQEYVGAGGSGNFYQSGGANSTTFLSVAAGATYALSAGSLTATGLSNAGSFTVGAATFTLGGYCDLSSATFATPAQVALTIQPAGVVVLPTGMNTSVFGTYSNVSGQVIHPGDDIPVVAGATITVAGQINNLVDCSGSLNVYSGASATLNGGLILRSASASAFLGNTYSTPGALVVENTRSAILGGKLTAYTQYVGYNASGASFAQSGGTNTLAYSLNVGYNAGSSGVYALSAGTLNVYSGEYIGNNGTGTFIQSGGINNTTGSYLNLGGYGGGSGTYLLSGGALNAEVCNVPNGGTGLFVQTGGTASFTNTLVPSVAVGTGTGSVGTYSLSAGGLYAKTVSIGGSSGTSSMYQSGGNATFATGLTLNAYSSGLAYYTLTGGSLAATNEYVATSGRGTFSQSGGTNAIASSLNVGNSWSAMGAYVLSSGTVSASNEYIGRAGTFGYTPGTGNFYQSGGANTATLVSVAPNSTYSLLGGSLVCTQFANAGALALSGTTSLTAGGIVNLAHAASVADLAGVRFTGQPNTLVILPAGASTSSFYSFSNPSGLTYVTSPTGAPLVITGATVTGGGAIDDFIDTTGAFNAYAGTDLTLNGGLLLHSVTASANLGANGFLRVENTASGMMGGTLTAANMQVGINAGGASFSQSGGTNTLTTALYLGYNPAAGGVYTLSSGQLNVKNYVYLGNTGNGTLVNTGGSVYVGYALYLGNSQAATGVYTMTGGSLNVSSNAAYIGYNGAGTVNQSGGGASFSYVYLGSSLGATGSYALSGGTLNANSGYVGVSGTGSFAQSGGTASFTNLTLGSGTGSGGSYALSSASVLKVGSEYVGSAGTASFFQSGGSHTATLLAINPTSSYSLSGGSLNCTQLANTGTLLLSGTVNLTAGGIVNLAHNASASDFSGVTFTGQANTLVILPAGTSTASSFLSFSNPTGVTVNAGTPLTIPANKSFSGGSMFDDFVDLYGTLSSYSGQLLAFNAGLRINTGASFSGQLRLEATASSMLGGTLSGTSEYIGYNTTASLVQSGGTHTYASAYFGYNPGAVGVYSLSAGNMLGTYSYVGNNGSGSFYQTGGTNSFTSTGGLILGTNAGSNGTYVLSGGVLVMNYGYEYVGYSGSGTFVHTGGTNTQTAHPIYVGYNAGSTGLYSLSGSGLLLSRGIEVFGYSGNGSFAQSGGTNSIANSCYLGYGGGGVGNYTLSNGLLTIPGTFGMQSGLYIGYSGIGTFTQTGGTNNVTNTTSIDFGVGYNPGGTGYYALSNGVLSVNGGESIGYNGIGTFVQSGGTNTSNGVTVGASFGSSGLYSLTNGLLTDRFVNQVAFHGTGSMVQSGGTHTVGGDIPMACMADGAGTYSLSGTGILTAANIWVGGRYSDTPGGTGSFYMAGGSATVSGMIKLLTSTSRFNLSGGALSTGTLNVAAGGFAQTGGLLTASTVNQRGGTISLGGTQSLYALSSLTISGGTTALVAGGTRVLTTNSLAISGSGTLDLADHDLILQSANPTADYATLKTLLIQARGTAGAWSGTGLTSSLATNATQELTGLALVRAADLGLTSFDNQTVNANSLLVKYTYVGDINLDNQITMDDYLALDANYLFGGTPRGWIDGDFNYNDQIDAGDYAAIDYAAVNGGNIPLGSQMMTLHTAWFGAAYTDAYNAIPEPASLALLALGAAGLLWKRRRS